jgi:tRNA-binding protein
MAIWSDFEKLDIRVGEILEVHIFQEARKPAYKLTLDFGAQIGVKHCSAQLTQCYLPTDLIGKQVLAIVNFPPRRIAGFLSEVLVLGTYSLQGVVLIIPQQPVSNGDKLG